MSLSRRTVLSTLGGGLALATFPLRATRPAISARVIDMHAHLSIPAYSAIFTQAGLTPPGYSARPGQPPPPGGGKGSDSPEAIMQRLAMMDEAGVATQLLSQSFGPYAADQATAIRAARFANDRHAAIAHAHSGRFEGLACLPLPHVDAAIAEIRRAFDELGLAGVGLHTACHTASIADPRFDPIFAELNRRNALVTLHPSVNGLMSPLILDWQLEAAAGTLIEDAVAVLELIASNVPARYPNIRIVISHLGGGLASMLERLDNLMPVTVPKLAGRPSEMARRFWYDTVAHGSRPALHAAVEAFGAARLVPGSDFPVLLPFEPYPRTFTYIADALDADNADLILHHNAQGLLAR
jgi:predicted TIM-barrel fold metal-dependent hydrolase